MATEDARYRQSSQFRLWSFSPNGLQELRQKTNSLAKQQIAPRLVADPPPEPLTVEEELELVKFYTVELLRAAEFIKLPTDSRSTAAIFLRRFYITNSIMTYPPTELLKTCLFFGCKADGVYYPLAQLAKMFPDTTSEQILAGEYLLCQGLRFAFDVRHPLRSLEGAILQLRKELPEEERRIQRAHARTREILKFSPLMTDAYFHYTPSQIMMAAMLMVDAELVDQLLPPDVPMDDQDTARATGIHSTLRGKIMTTLESCRAMLEQERPERMKEYWGVVSRTKSNDGIAMCGY
jgi:cyclin H